MTKQATLTLTAGEATIVRLALHSYAERCAADAYKAELSGDARAMNRNRRRARAADALFGKIDEACVSIDITARCADAGIAKLAFPGSATRTPLPTEI